MSGISLDEEVFFCAASGEIFTTYREYVDHAFQYILPKWECAAKSARVKQREKCLMFQDAWAMEQFHVRRSDGALKMHKYPALEEFFVHFIVNRHEGSRENLAVAMLETLSHVFVPGEILSRTDVLTGEKLVLRPITPADSKPEREIMPMKEFVELIFGPKFDRKTYSASSGPSPSSAGPSTQPQAYLQTIWMPTHFAVISCRNQNQMSPQKILEANPDAEVEIIPREKLSRRFQIGKTFSKTSLSNWIGMLFSKVNHTGSFFLSESMCLKFNLPYEPPTKLSAKRSAEEDVKDSSAPPEKKSKFLPDDLEISHTGEHADKMWPMPSQEFLVPRRVVPELLMVWDFCQTFSDLLSLAPFSLDKFQDALNQDRVNVPSSLAELEEELLANGGPLDESDPQVAETSMDGEMDSQGQEDEPRDGNGETASVEEERGTAGEQGAPPCVIRTHRRTTRNSAGKNVTLVMNVMDVDEEEDFEDEDDSGCDEEGEEEVEEEEEDDDDDDDEIDDEENYEESESEGENESENEWVPSAASSSSQPVVGESWLLRGGGDGSSVDSLLVQIHFRLIDNIIMDAKFSNGRLKFRYQRERKDEFAWIPIVLQLLSIARFQYRGGIYDRLPVAMYLLERHGYLSLTVEDKLCVLSVLCHEYLQASFPQQQIQENMNELNQMESERFNHDRDARREYKEEMERLKAERETLDASLEEFKSRKKELLGPEEDSSGDEDGDGAGSQTEETPLDMSVDRTAQSSLRRQRLEEKNKKNAIRESLRSEREILDRKDRELRYREQKAKKKLQDELLFTENAIANAAVENMVRSKPFGCDRYRRQYMRFLSCKDESRIFVQDTELERKIHEARYGPNYYNFDEFKKPLKEKATPEVPPMLGQSSQSTVEELLDSSPFGFYAHPEEIESLEQYLDPAGIREQNLLKRFESEGQAFKDSMRKHSGNLNKSANSDRSHVSSIGVRVTRHSIHNTGINTGYVNTLLKPSQLRKNERARRMGQMSLTSDRRGGR